jgi:hypothetical protein
MTASSLCFRCSTSAAVTSDRPDEIGRDRVDQQLVVDPAGGLIGKHDAGVVEEDVEIGMVSDQPCRNAIDTGRIGDVELNRDLIIGQIRRFDFSNSTISGNLTPYCPMMAATANARHRGGCIMINRRHLLAASAAGLACSATDMVPYGLAQPGGKTARMLVGFPAGGNVDFVARLLANELKSYSSTMIIENRPGAAGRFALDGLKSSAADGSTMTLTPRGHDRTLSAHL